MARKRLTPATDGIVSLIAGIIFVIIAPDKLLPWVILCFGVLKTIVSQR